MDGHDEVLTAARENLRMGASQLKVTAGGGTSSAYDPIDVTQFTPEELQAAAIAAADWNTYVTARVHAEIGTTCGRRRSALHRTRPASRSPDGRSARPARDLAFRTVSGSQHAEYALSLIHI